VLRSRLFFCVLLVVAAIAAVVGIVAATSSGSSTLADKIHDWMNPGCDRTGGFMGQEEFERPYLENPQAARFLGGRRFLGAYSAHGVEAISVSCKELGNSTLLWYFHSPSQALAAAPLFDGFSHGSAACVVHSVVLENESRLRLVRYCRRLQGRLFARAPGGRVLVPRLIGERPPEAIRDLRALGLHAKFTALSNLCAGIPPHGHIELQAPRAGVHISVGVTVKLQTSCG
jgi:hypothetical protein